MDAAGDRQHVDPDQDVVQVSNDEVGVGELRVDRHGPWAGRRWLAGIDALLWPGLWIAGVWFASLPTGVAGLLFAAAAVWCAVQRLCEAVFENERYRFTTWRWARPVVGLVLIGALLKLALGSLTP